MTTKVKASITIDADLMAEFGRDNLSREVNEVLRAELEHREQRRRLGDLLADLAAERGPTDPAEVAEFAAMLR